MRGYYYEPTCSPSHDQEAIARDALRTVLTVIPYDDESEAVAMRRLPLRAGRERWTDDP